FSRDWSSDVCSSDLCAQADIVGHVVGAVPQNQVATGGGRGEQGVHDPLSLGAIGHLAECPHEQYRDRSGDVQDVAGVGHHDLGIDRKSVVEGNDVQY